MKTIISTIDGHVCDVELTREDGGYSFKVWRQGPPRALGCMGWIMGTFVEGLSEAEEYARITMAAEPLRGLACPPTTPDPQPEETAMNDEARVAAIRKLIQWYGGSMMEVSYGNFHG